MDPMLMHGLERLLVVIGGIVFAYLGYRLYALGVEKGRVTADAELSFAKIAVAGGGPGLGFMAMGGVVLLLAIYFGDASHTQIDQSADQSRREVRMSVRRPAYDLDDYAAEKPSVAPSPWAQTASAHERQKWEITQTGLGEASLKMGEEGWELVAVDQGTFYFKRPR